MPLAGTCCLSDPRKRGLLLFIAGDQRPTGEMRSNSALEKAGTIRKGPILKTILPFLSANA